MRGGLGFLTLIIVLAVLKAALSVIVVAIGLALVVSFVTRPRETLALIITIGLFSMAHAHPVAFVVALAITIGLVWLVWAVGQPARRRTNVARIAASDDDLLR
ncbi:hypothetical protein ASG17_00800 [Brevundimonas sp. Leaf363]|uniref:hypothetical protein n=1 Tax=Brevundimonas sp. Leaf363 TaxID=1736353 RepID=UPI0006FA7886|nr:hypothetical protein [Brevundimonas sp. Leaf363]KQS57306.1 hypothetical protein ASG17_00800 [Brevundimonas sp. Leaf363]